MPEIDARRNLLSIATTGIFWDALWLELGQFLVCYVGMSQNHVLTLAIDSWGNLLPNVRLERFGDALWLGIGPFLCSTLESHRIFANIFLSVETPFV